MDKRYKSFGRENIFKLVTVETKKEAKEVKIEIAIEDP